MGGTWAAVRLRGPSAGGVYAAVFIDAIMVKVRDGQVSNRPFYAAIGVTLEGRKDVLGLWVGTGGEGAKFWLQVLLGLEPRQIVLLVVTFIAGVLTVVPGRATRLQGEIHLILFAAYLVLSIYP